MTSCTRTRCSTYRMVAAVLVRMGGATADSATSSRRAFPPPHEAPRLHRLATSLGSCGSDRCIEDVGCEANAGGADPHSGTGNQLPGFGGGAAAERAGGVSAGLAAIAAPVARSQCEVAVEFTLDGRNVNLQVVENPPGT